MILGIESSCDETGVALYCPTRGLLAHALHTQVALHAAYGGVVPELASRDHIRRWVYLTEQVCKEASARLSDISGIAYTQGPGLAGALLVGAAAAAGLGAALGRPIVGVHHLEGHLLSPLLASPPPQFPFVALLVSGGHTQLMAVRGVGAYTLMGETLDDAAGEAFDKSAKLMGLGYPGGPALAACAEGGDPMAVKLPRPMLAELKREGNLNFSFSGLKTAVSLAHRRGAETGLAPKDLAASVQEAIAEVLIAKSIAACEQARLSTLVVAGGVGANLRLRALLDAAAARHGITVHYPPLHLCTDNGAMIALAGAHRLARDGRRDYAFTVRPRWPLAELLAV
jgi:N6-L-threonylcarbamoyladenine synthase